MDPITAKRISAQLDALTSALHRVADGIEAVLHMLLDQAGVTVSLTEEPARDTVPIDAPPFSPQPKTMVQCRSCRAPWAETHFENCLVAAGLPVERRDCDEVPRVAD